jgi:predicted RNA-binding Zn ribbon-like protein
VDFGSHAQRVVTVAAGVVNALSAGFERGVRLADPLPQDVRLARLLDAFGPAADDLTAAITRPDGSVDPAALTVLEGLVAELRPVFTLLDAAREARQSQPVGEATGDPMGEAARRVNDLMERFRSVPYLARHGDGPWHLHYHDEKASFVEGWAAGCAAGLAVVIGSPAYDRVGVCTAQECDRVYVDLSRNGSRRFCSTACQNRVKAAAFRARRRSD